MFLHYVNQTADMLVKTAQAQTEITEKAARFLADSIAQGGVIHVFGCGHSHLLAEELFYRAGGLACMNPVLMEDVMLHKGAVRSSQLERQNGFAHSFIDKVDIRTGDVMIVISTSGINPVPIDVQLLSKEKGAKTIALTSLSYSEKAASRHQNGLKLSDVSDLVIDNGAPYGDAIVSSPGIPAPFAPVSTVMGAALLNGVIAAAIERLNQTGFTPPVFLSGNRPGADTHNEKLIKQYEQRIPLLRFKS